MSTLEVESVLQSLEASWFEAARAASHALSEIKKRENAETPALLEEAMVRFDAAQVLKRQIMREIEAIEDALIE
jgi:hypothetical protein